MNDNRTSGLSGYTGVFPGYIAKRFSIFETCGEPAEPFDLRPSKSEIGVSHEIVQRLNASALNKKCPQALNGNRTKGLLAAAFALASKKD